MNAIKYTYESFRYGAVAIYADDGETRRNVTFLQGEEAWDLVYQLEHASDDAKQSILSGYDMGSN